MPFETNEDIFGVGWQCVNRTLKIPFIQVRFFLSNAFFWTGDHATRNARVGFTRSDEVPGIWSYLLTEFVYGMHSPF